MKSTDKKDIKDSLRPLIKQCVKELLLEEGLLQEIIRESTRSIASVLVEARQQQPVIQYIPVQPAPQYVQQPAQAGAEQNKKQKLLELMTEGYRQDAEHYKKDDNTMEFSHNAQREKILQHLDKEKKESLKTIVEKNSSLGETLSNRGVDISSFFNKLSLGGK